jgi:hypothetical protein
MIELLLINSLIIWGFYASIQEGMIFAKLGLFIRGKYLKEPDGKDDLDMPIGYHLPAWIKKPLGTCPVCMSSVYGFPIFWFAYLTNLINYDYIIFMYICYTFALAGLNYLILLFVPE